MITVTRDTVIPSVNQTLEVLRMHNQLVPQLLDFDKIHQYWAYYQLILRDKEPELREALRLASNQQSSYRTYLLSYLIKTGQTAGLEKTKTGYSLDKDSIAGCIATGMVSEDTVKLLTLFQEYDSAKRTAGTLLRLLQNPVVDMMSCDKHRMIYVQPRWEPQNTGRVAMCDPAIQNLPRGIQDIQTVPYGYVLLHTDSGQIEPRTTYSTFCADPQIIALINLYNDAYFGVLHYVTKLTEADIASGRIDFEKMEITDEIKNMRQSIKTNNNAVMYGAKSNVKDDPVKAAMIRRIGNHPLRLQKIREIETLLDKGIYEFPTAFGTKIDIRNSDKLQSITDPKYYREECIKLAINNPIQGTAADLMRLSVAEADKLINRKGKKSAIINYVHDAGVFAIHEDDYDAIADELATIVSYNVPGWIPITAEPEFTRQANTNKLFADLY